MANEKHIAIAKLAKVLTNDTIFSPKLHDRNELWAQILTISGQKALWDKYRGSLTPLEYNNYYRNYQNNPDYIHNRFTSVFEILHTVYSSNVDGDFNQLISTIASHIYVQDVFYGVTGDEDEPHWERLEWLQNFYSNPDTFRSRVEPLLRDDFREFQNCLRILGFDVILTHYNVDVRPFTEGLIERSRDISRLEAWLKQNYPSVANNYEEALKAFSVGSFVSCVSSCRTILTGVFDKHMQPGSSKWFNGLYQVTETREPLIPPDKISDLRDLAQQSRGKGGLQGDYKRFLSIYHLYSLVSHLGSHNTEGNNGDKFVNSDDALFCLRVSEDVLIYTMNILAQKTT